MITILFIILVVTVILQHKKIKNLKKENKALKYDQAAFRKEAERFINKCMR